VSAKQIYVNHLPRLVIDDDIMLAGWLADDEVKKINWKLDLATRKQARARGRERECHYLKRHNERH